MLAKLNHIALYLFCLFALVFFVVKLFTKPTTKKEIIWPINTENSYMEDVTVERFVDGKRTIFYIKKLIIKQ